MQYSVCSVEILVVYCNEPGECMIVSNKRGGGRGGDGSRSLSEEPLRSSAELSLFMGLLHFMETSLLDLSFDANWRMRSSGAGAYGQEAPQSNSTASGN